MDRGLVISSSSSARTWARRLYAVGHAPLRDVDVRLDRFRRY
ncbi:hypothetical protein [Amycolatopsis sp. cmx-4-61]